MAIVKKSKNLRKPANVGDRRFPRPKGGLLRGWYHFTCGYTTTTVIKSVRRNAAIKIKMKKV